MAVEAKPTGIMAAGAFAGCALLLFAGALIGSSQMGLMEEAASAIHLRGRNLQGLAQGVVNAQGISALTISTPAPDLTVQTTVGVTTSKGSLTLLVAQAGIFVVGQWITIGGVTIATSTPENRHIKAIDTVTNILSFYKPLEYNHQKGEVVVLEPESLAGQSFNQLSSGGHGSSGKSMGSFKSSLSSGGSSESLQSSESGSSKGDLITAGATTHGAISGSSWLGNFFLSLCFACIYKSKVVDPMGVMRHQPLQHEMNNDFRYGLCDCWKDPNICLMTLCCPFVRMAHTNEAADVCGFWESLVCMWCSTLCLCGPLCLQVYFRIHIKDHMGIHDHCFNDFCVAFCCLFCVTAQQAMSVDEALGWKFKCPCSIEHAGPLGGYGKPEHGY